MSYKVLQKVQIMFLHSIVIIVKICQCLSSILNKGTFICRNNKKQSYLAARQLWKIVRLFLQTTITTPLHLDTPYFFVCTIMDSYVFALLLQLLNKMLGWPAKWNAVKLTSKVSKGRPLNKSRKVMQVQIYTYKCYLFIYLSLDMGIS